MQMACSGRGALCIALRGGTRELMGATEVSRRMVVAMACGRIGVCAVARLCWVAGVAMSMYTCARVQLTTC